MKGKQTKGLTLIEVLVTCAVLSLFLTVASKTLLSYKDAFSKVESSQPAMKGLAHGMEAVKREIFSCYSVLLPAQRKTALGWEPSWQEATPFLFRRWNSNGASELVGMAFDKKLDALVIRNYEEPDPKAKFELEKLVVTNTRTITNTSGLWLKLERNSRATMVSLKLESPVEKRLPLQTLVRIPRTVFKAQILSRESR